jgi:hypothetical protein
MTHKWPFGNPAAVLESAIGKASCAVLVLVLAACAAPEVAKVSAPLPAVDPLDAVRAQRDLELLMTYLQGTWETIPQPSGEGDSTPMRLRFARLWPERDGEYWLYAEYVKTGDESRALRQRIFGFKREGAVIVGRSYRVPGDSASSVGEWRKERPFAGSSPASLSEIEGCRAVWVKQAESLFAAGTTGSSCRGDLPEVRDEHSDFYLGSTSLRSWIRGLDPSGKQVTGPSGPSEFRKIDRNLR